LRNMSATNQHNTNLEKHTNSLPKICVEEAMLSLVDREDDKNPMKVVIASEAPFGGIARVREYHKFNYDM